MAELPAYPGIPRWVKILGIIALVLVLLVGIAHLTGVTPASHTPPIQHGG